LAKTNVLPCIIPQMKKWLHILHASHKNNIRCNYTQLSFLEALTSEERRKLAQLRDMPDPAASGAYDDDGGGIHMDVDDVLDGRVILEPSHGGGELNDMLEAGIAAELNPKRKCVPYSILLMHSM
jgi:hypothetical protein